MPYLPLGTRRREPKESNPGDFTQLGLLNVACKNLAKTHPKACGRGTGKQTLEKAGRLLMFNKHVLIWLSGVEPCLANPKILQEKRTLFISQWQMSKVEDLEESCWIFCVIVKQPNLKSLPFMRWSNILDWFKQILFPLTWWWKR